jgi:hypothetical protein
MQKNGLGDVLRQMRVTIDEPDGRGIDEVDVAADDFLKGRFRAVFGILDKQFLDLRHIHLPVKPRPGPKPNRKKPVISDRPVSNQ